jgi:pimeloyl-ACP methyl ester carboxylesterase
VETERARPEKVRVEINGLRQGMFLTGVPEPDEDGEMPTKPVLLFLHGGPGMPEFFLTRRRPAGIDEDFIVCWWEQRGAGLSYRPRIPPASMTLDQFIADAIAVTDYLRERFGVEKVVLVGHSWGSYLGIQVAAAAPERFSAYVGMGQMVHQIESERRAQAFMIARFREMGKTRMVRRLARAPVPVSPPLPRAYERVRDKGMHRLGVGTTRDMRSVFTGIFLPVWREGNYTLPERAAIWAGKRFSHRSGLWNQMLATDLEDTVPELAVPAYFLHGAYDQTVSYPMARGYFETLQAPTKGFYTFSESAHSPLFEEPERARAILRDDVLTGTADLADRR